MSEEAFRKELLERGERRHEQCRFGRLSEAYSGDGMSGEWTPTTVPICGWLVPDPKPPGVRRAWGGNAVDYDRDCAVCDCFDPL